MVVRITTRIKTRNPSCHILRNEARLEGKEKRTLFVQSYLIGLFAPKLECGLNRLKLDGSELKFNQDQCPEWDGKEVGEWLRGQRNQRKNGCWESGLSRGFCKRCTIVTLDPRESTYELACHSIDPSWMVRLSFVQI